MVGLIIMADPHNNLLTGLHSVCVRSFLLDLMNNEIYEEEKALLIFRRSDSFLASLADENKLFLIDVYTNSCTIDIFSFLRCFEYTPSNCDKCYTEWKAFGILNKFVPKDVGITTYKVNLIETVLLSYEGFLIFFHWFIGYKLNLLIKMSKCIDISEKRPSIQINSTLNNTTNINTEDEDIADEDYKKRPNILSAIADLFGLDYDRCYYNVKKTLIKGVMISKKKIQIQMSLWYWNVSYGDRLFAEILPPVYKYIYIHIC